MEKGKGGLIALSHITVKEKQELLRELAKGYKEMSEINTNLAEEGVASDNESLSKCEDSLTESD